jgi:biotin synthase-related radical SAM superfamily protein
MANNKKNTTDHRARKNMGSAEFFRKQRKERNAARPKQRFVESSASHLTMQQIADLSEGEVLAIVPAHWERP